MFVLISLIAAVLPALIFVFIIYWVDRYEKEPIPLLMATFFWGAVPSIILGIILGILGTIPFYVLAGEGAGDVLGAVLVAPPVEETLKAMALLAIFFLWRNEIDSLLDGIIYGAMVGMGFAMVENFLYFLNVTGDLGDLGSLIVLRAFVFGLNHSLFTGMTGLGLAISRLSNKTWVRWTAPVLGWMAAIFLHFVHNLGASVGGFLCIILPITDWGGVWFLVGITIWALVQEQRWIKQYLAEEVSLGVLTSQQYEIASSTYKRFLHRYGLLFSRGPVAYWNSSRFFQYCSELAYKKHHALTLKESKSEQLTQQLREKVRLLSSQM